jgi:phage head maturation protease
MSPTNHQIEHAAAGSTVEQADARGHAGDAALRFAPPWVRERIAAIREERGLDREVENRAVVEHAAEDRATAAVTRSLRYAPPHIRRSVNRARRRSGLAELHFASATPDVGVWVRDRATGTIRPATTTTSRSPARPATPRATPRPVPAVVERVLIVPCPSFADAPARNVRSAFDETIAPDAFGPAAELNRDDRWDLRLGHHGPRLALPGPALRAHDTSHGLVVEWHLDSRMPMAPEAREAIRRGAVSVAFKAIGTRTIRLPEPTTLVTRATLLHVALLPDNQQPAHPAAVAMLFPGSRLGDARQFREQLAAVVAEAKFRNWRSRS